MAFCKHCGNQLPDDAAFCSNCGTPVDNAQQTGQQNVQQNAQQTGQQNVQQNAQQADQQTAQQAPQQLVQPEVMNSDGTVLNAEKGLAWLAYIPWAPVFLVPLFVRKTSEYCKYHVKQGATLWAVGIAYEIVKAIFLAIINAIFPGHRVYYLYYHSAVYNVFSFIFWAGSIFLFVLAIIGIVYAATGKKKELPLIGKIPWVGMLIDRIYAFINK